MKVKYFAIIISYNRNHREDSLNMSPVNLGTFVAKPEIEEESILALWSDFQKTQPDTDAEFTKFLIGHDVFSEFLSEEQRKEMQTIVIDG